MRFGSIEAKTEFRIRITEQNATINTRENKQILCFLPNTPNKTAAYYYHQIIKKTDTNNMHYMIVQPNGQTRNKLDIPKMHCRTHGGYKLTKSIQGQKL